MRFFSLFLICYLIFVSQVSLALERAQAREIFLSVWEKVDQSFYDRTFGGVDWVAVKERYQKELSKIKTDSELRSLLNAMLDELGRSHFAVLGADSPNAPSSHRYLGVSLRFLDEKLVISEVKKESPAAKAGIKPGMEILEIETEPLTQVYQRYGFQPKLGKLFQARVAAEILDEMQNPDDGKITLKMAGGSGLFDFPPAPYLGEWGTFTSAGRYRMEFSAWRTSEKVQVIDFNLFVPQLMPRLLEAIATAQKDQLPGLIFDLRGNPGGLAIMASGLIGRLVDQELDLGDMNNPQGNFPFHAFPQPNAYLGPLAVLVDSFSASTSEIFAAALQEHGRARIFGRATTGAVLPSVIEQLPNGDQLQYAIGDFVTDLKKIRLEGKGVTPDTIIPLDPAALRAGRDPAMEAAVRWLLNQKS